VSGDQGVLADLDAVTDVHVGRDLGAAPHERVADRTALDHRLHSYVGVVFEQHATELGERHQTALLATLIAHARAADRGERSDAHVAAHSRVHDPGACALHENGGRRIDVGRRAVGSQFGEEATDHPGHGRP
jgi:hypothetical protein